MQQLVRIFLVFTLAMSVTSDIDDLALTRIIYESHYKFKFKLKFQDLVEIPLSNQQSNW